ncbi:MAG: zinc-binding alcohol dehydrogenase family protein [Gemmataceae bacterium]|nr:zinc-binding alcohol dehydrogenase family protein [Gemmataceae bacterium]
MKTILLQEPKNFQMIDTPEPGKPGPGEALLRVHSVGICGTDYSGYLGKMPFYTYPRIPGHELGVEIAALGEGVTHVQVGDRCCVEPYINCQKCHSCERGHTNACEFNKTLGVMADGGLRKYFILPARKLFPSKKLTFEQLALVETLAIGSHAVNRAKAMPGENALIIGAGPIGLSNLEFIKVAGCRPIVMDMNEQRLAFVRDKMNVKDTILAKGDGKELDALKELTNGRLAHVVIDATGSNASMSNAYNFVGYAGRLVFVGITMSEVVFKHPLMHRHEMTFLASRNALPGDFANTIRLIEEGKIDTKPWITHQAPLEGMIDVFPQWLKPETGVIKAVVAVG